MTQINRNSYSTNKLRIAYCGANLIDGVYKNLNNKFQIVSSENNNQFNEYLTEQSLSTLPEIILIEADEREQCFEVIADIRKNPLLKGLIIVLLAAKANQNLKQKVRQQKIHDFYVEPFSYDELAERLDFLVRFKLIKPNLVDLSKKVSPTYKTPFSKRIFDLVFSISLILLLLPIFVIMAGLIAIESDGKIIYKSKRVGTGYHVFNFYKFRSMRHDADKQLSRLNILNQYTGVDKAGNITFVKLKNDPRITRIGAFLRKTSIDELPQLFNIIKGDMSVVGNRPLPLYEAEQLTSNEWSTRFLAPAGLTGLWQITRRGNAYMSERERKKLDNFYSNHYSFWFDMKIILGTIPAILQKEKV